MQTAFIACWCDMRIYAIQASRMRESLEAEQDVDVRVVTSNCGCYYSGFKTAFSSLFNHKLLLTTRDVTFVNIPHFRLHKKSAVDYILRLMYRTISEPLRAYCYAAATRDAGIVHFHQASDAFGYSALKQYLRHAKNKKIVVTIYSLSPVQHETPACNELYNDVDAVIVSTDFMKQKLIRDGVKKNKVFVIPFGATMKPIPERQREGIIMFSGAPLINVKGFEYLAPALKMLRDNGCPVKLKLHGFYMPGHREWAESIAKKEGIQDLITWLNCSNEQELMHEYQKSRCCVVPYTDYPGCFPVTMAMANATPVIVSDAMGLPEYVNDGGGMTVRSRSVHDLAEALGKMQTDNNLHKQLSYQCRDIAEKNFAWDVVSRNVHSVYSSIAS